MKKYERAYRNYAEAKRVLKPFIQSLRASNVVLSVKTTTYAQKNNIQRYFHIFKAQKGSKSG